MARSLGYIDAVRLLGGQDSKLVSALEKVTGGILLGATPVAPAILGLFDAKAEFVRISHDLVRAITERRDGLSRMRVPLQEAELTLGRFFFIHRTRTARTRPASGRTSSCTPPSGSSWSRA